MFHQVQLNLYVHEAGRLRWSVQPALGVDEFVVIPDHHTAPGGNIIWELQYETCTDESMSYVLHMV